MYDMDIKGSVATGRPQGPMTWREQYYPAKLLLSVSAFEVPSPLNKRTSTVFSILPVKLKIVLAAQPILSAVPFLRRPRSLNKIRAARGKSFTRISKDELWDTFMFGVEAGTLEGLEKLCELRKACMLRAR